MVTIEHFERMIENLEEWCAENPELAEILEKFKALENKPWPTPEELFPDFATEPNAPPAAAEDEEQDGTNWWFYGAGALVVVLLGAFVQLRRKS
ncbi:MAG: hypothetical protein U5N86_04970 [Planctomycetota bacterium]|nr:hypothetical protein [Planctomycetota bacterium]